MNFVTNVFTGSLLAQQECVLGTYPLTSAFLDLLMKKYHPSILFVVTEILPNYQNWRFVEICEQQTFGIYFVVIIILWFHFLFLFLNWYFFRAKSLGSMFQISWSYLGKFNETIAKSNLDQDSIHWGPNDSKLFRVPNHQWNRNWSRVG